MNEKQNTLLKSVSQKSKISAGRIDFWRTSLDDRQRVLLEKETKSAGTQRYLLESTRLRGKYVEERQRFLLVESISDGHRSTIDSVFCWRRRRNLLVLSDICWNRPV